MRSAIFVLVGAILGAAATFFFGMILHETWDGGMTQLAYRLVFGGTLVGALLGLLSAQVARPTVSRRTRLIVIGPVGGLLAGFVYGVLTLECVTADAGDCGWVFLDRTFQYPWIPIALWSVSGAVIGALLGWTAAGIVRGRSPAPAPAPLD